MTDAAITALSQAGSAGLVIIVVGLFLRHLETMDKRNQEFIREQRTASNEALARLAEEIKTLSNITHETRNIVVRHDAQVESRLPVPRTGPLGPMEAR